MERALRLRADVRVHLRVGRSSAVLGLQRVEDRVPERREARRECERDAQAGAHGGAVVRGREGVEVHERRGVRVGALQAHGPA